MRTELAVSFHKEMQAARMAWARNDLKACFSYLERAHILGQRNLWSHFLTHAWMLRVGWRQRDYHEVFGQILRLVATVPGALIGWVPAGNTGGAKVPALKPMPLPPEFKPYFAKHSMLRSILIRLAVISVVIALVVVARWYGWL